MLDGGIDEATILVSQQMGKANHDEQDYPMISNTFSIIKLNKWLSICSFNNLFVLSKNDNYDL